MAKGKIICIEGTDCSGKQTQQALLAKYLEEKGEKVFTFSYPAYDSPTGKIIGGPYLGKDYICEGWFPEGAPSVDPKVACLYYAADRRYHNPEIIEKLNEGYTVLLDRYTYSNMGHQASKMKTKEDRKKLYDFISDLEFGLLEMPKADSVILLYMPPEMSKKLREDRQEKLDELERDENHLHNAAAAYLEMAELYNFKVIECIKDGEVRSIEDIHAEVVKTYESLR